MKNIGVFVGGFVLGAVILWTFSPSKSDSSPDETFSLFKVQLACESVERSRGWSSPAFKENIVLAARMDPQKYLSYLEDYNYLTVRYPDQPISNPEDFNAFLAVSRLNALCDLNSGN